MDPLRVDLDLNYKKKYDRHIMLGRFLYNNKLVRKIFFRVKRIMDTFHTDYFNYTFDAGEPDMSMRLGDYFIRTEKDVTGHSDENRFVGLKFFIENASKIYNQNFDPATQKSPTMDIYREQEKLLPDFLNGDEAIKKVLNFGTSYGCIDSFLAKQFDHIQFLSIDVDEYCRVVNELEFPDIGNLRFYSGNIFDLMESEDFEDSVFHHSRMLVQFSEEFVEKLYRTCFEKRFKYIVGFEYFGYSRETKEPFVEFTEKYKKSVHWRIGIQIHNYPGILKKCGYTIKQIHAFRPAHASPDYHVLAFIAERSDTKI